MFLQTVQGTIAIVSADKFNVWAQDDMILSAGEKAQFSSHGDGMQIQSDGLINIIAGTISNIKSGGQLDVTAGTILDLNSGGGSPTSTNKINLN